MTTIGNRARTLVIALLVGIIALGVGIAVAHNDGTEIRITAMRHEDGRVEFAVQERDGEAWGERVLPRARFFPTTSEGRWLNSTPITVGPSSDLRDGFEVTVIPELEPPEAPGTAQPGMRIQFVLDSAREYAIDIRRSEIAEWTPARGLYTSNEGVASTDGIVEHWIGYGSMGSFGLDYSTKYDVRVRVIDCCESVVLSVETPPPAIAKPSFNGSGILGVRYTTDTDHITGQLFTLLAVQARYVGSYGEERMANLLVGCNKESYFLVLATGRKHFWFDAPVASGTYRIDAQESITQNWVITGSANDDLYPSQAPSLIRRLRGAQRLQIRTPETPVLVFNVSNLFDTPAQVNLDNCEGSYYSPAP